MPNQSTRRKSLPAPPAGSGKDRPGLDALFRALADPTRRAVVERLGRGPSPMTQLASSFTMALPSFAQHLAVLEQSGLVRSQKSGRQRIYALVPEALDPAEGWLDQQRQQWTARFDRMEAFLKNQMEKP